MPAVIPQRVKDEVFQSWLEGSFRRQTATKHGVSEGTVSNVVAERKLQHGSDKLDVCRALSLALSRSGLSILDCVIGHRVAMIMRQMGADEEHFEVFFEMLWELYKKAGLGPDSLIREIEELHYFRETNQSMHRTALSVSEICENIKMKQAEANSLDSMKNNLRKSISDMQFQKAALEDELRAYREFKDMLKAKGIQTEDIINTADLAAFVKRSGYGIREVTEKFATFSELDNACNVINSKVMNAGLEYDQLSRVNASVHDSILRNSQKIRELEFLKKKGFGHLEFKELHYLVDEIEEQNGMPAEHTGAIGKFFESLRNHYYEFCNLGKKVNELNSDVAKIRSAQDYLSAKLNLTPQVTRMIEFLVHEGIKKDDLPDIVKTVIENYLPSISTTSNSLKKKPSSENYSNFESKLGAKNTESTTNTVVERNTRNEEGIWTWESDEESDTPACVAVAHEDLNTYGKRQVTNEKIAPSIQKKYSQENYSDSKEADPQSRDHFGSTDSVRQSKKPGFYLRNDVEVMAPKVKHLGEWSAYVGNIRKQQVNESQILYRENIGDPTNPVEFKDNSKNRRRYRPPQNLDRSVRKVSNDPPTDPASYSNIGVQRIQPNGGGNRDKFSIRHIEYNLNLHAKNTDDITGNAILRKEDAISNSTEDARFDCGRGAGPVAIPDILGSDSYHFKTKGSNKRKLDNYRCWQSKPPEKNHDHIDLVSLVDESITKPLMRQATKLLSEMR